MKYDPSTDYLFECELIASGLNSDQVEKNIQKMLQDIIEDGKVKAVVLSNESTDKSDIMVKIFSIIQEMQCFIGGKILHIGRVPIEWKQELIKEMEDKKELSEKRKMHIDDCIMILIENNNAVKALILNRKSVYCISENPPR